MLLLLLSLPQIQGLKLGRFSTGVAGENAVGKVTQIDDSVAANGLSVNDNVLVIGTGTWTSNGKFPASSLFKIPNNLNANQSASFPSLLIAYGMLTKYVKLGKGDLVLQSDKPSPIASAVTQLGKHFGVNVVSSSLANYSNKEFVTQLKSQGKIKLGLCLNDAKLLKSLYKAAGAHSTIVIYNDMLEKFEDIDGFHLSVAKAVFEDVSVCGFNLNGWAAADHEGVQAAVNAIAKLISDKAVSATPSITSFPHADFVKALAAAQEGKSAILTF